MTGLDFFTEWRGEKRVNHVAGIAGTGGLKAQDVGFLGGDHAMFDASGYYKEFPRSQGLPKVAVFDLEVTAPHQEHDIAVFMCVPRKFALHLDQLEIVAIETGSNLGPPVFLELGKPFGNADDFHRDLSLKGQTYRPWMTAI